MDCLIVDDNPMARAALRQIVSKLDGLTLLGECASAIEAYNRLLEEPVDLLLLDVEMPDMTGLDLLQQLPVRPLAILVTSKKDYAAEAYNLNVVDYIVKPVTLPRFLAAVQKAREIWEGRSNIVEKSTEKENLFVRADGALVKLWYADILWIQAMVDYVQFFLANGKKVTVHATLKGVEEHLADPRFVRTHRSYIVNLDKIDRIEEGSMIIIGRQVIPISEQYRPTVLKQLNVL
ncbi:MAG: response regulator transcription factor [Lewinellaceae bacterium]|nr:response regulator transcription factor [Lewinellaceae bacterium]